MTDSDREDESCKFASVMILCTLLGGFWLAVGLAIGYWWR